MLSMTGYGEGAAASEGCAIEVAIRTVNHRYLDLSVRLPEALRGLEAEIEARVRGRIRRGRVEVKVEITRLAPAELEVEVRRDLVAALAGELERLRGEGLVTGELTAADLLRLPGAVAIRETAESWTDADGAALAEAVDRAVEAVVDARRREGERLLTGLAERVADLGRLRLELERLASEAREGVLSDLRARLDELLGASGLPEERLAAEAAILVERADVREELDRFAAHLAALEEGLASDEPVGKRLDFLAQEVLRELNTTAAKSRRAEMVAAAVEGKLLCEQIREQIQNVE